MGEINVKKKLKVLNFTLQNAQLCTDIKRVDKVIQLPMLKRVPGSPYYLVGLLNMAGISIPVVDLALRLGLQRQQAYHLDTIILLCSSKERKMGMIVDKVTGLNEIEEGKLQMRMEFNQPLSPFIAIATIKEELSLLLDIEKIMHSDTIFDVALFDVNEMTREKEV